jgi:cystathionine beta-lyase
MPFDFDQAVDRRASDSIKWQRYGPAVLPLWVADMDFPAPPPIIAALQDRVAHGVFGYAAVPPALPERICARLARRYQWPVTPAQIIFLPGLVSGLNVVCRAVGEPGDSVLVPTPVYPPFLSAPVQQQRQLRTVELRPVRQGDWLDYAIDFDALAAAIDERTRLLLLCHPQNPTGRVYGVAELTRLAELCRERGVVICSDEIHCDLLLGDARHVPLATLSSAIAEHCITLMAPSKTFNIPGLGISFAVVGNADLRNRLNAAMAGIVPHLNVLGISAALAAYSGECDEWLTALLAYLTANRDYLVTYVKTQWPAIDITCPAATCLAWLDCRRAGISGRPYQFFLEKAKVALNDGVPFGPGGNGFVRLNFGCMQAVLVAALARMGVALAGGQVGCYDDSPGRKPVA